jgi:putative tricarboxylic transport membrane protein
MVFGVFVGATPGLTATMAVALIVPLSLQLEDPNAGLAMVIGVSFTAIFAGDIPATWLRIPGTPASAAATLDGHVLAKRGRGDHALKLDLVCSCIGGIIGVAVLMFLAPQLAKVALKFSNFEYFWLAMFGLTMSAAVSAGHTLKGLLAATLGMMVSTVGIDVTSAAPRFTFESTALLGGIPFIPVMIGLFGLSEVLRNACRSSSMSLPAGGDEQTVGFDETIRTVVKHKFTVIKSAIVGTFIGALPGAGADIAAWGAYGLAKKTSKTPEKFGNGTEEGVIAPTSANNAAVAGAWIPALVFGIPGDAVTAIVLGAMLMYDLQPGPKFFAPENADQMRTIFSIAMGTQFLLLVAGYCGIRVFRWVLRLPRSAVLTVVVVFSVVGSYSLNNRMFDVYVMVVAGVVGYFLDAKKVPLAPLILGLILGPIAEDKLRAGLISEQGNLVPMFTRPICAGLVVLLLLILLGPLVTRFLKSRR